MHRPVRAAITYGPVVVEHDHLHFRVVCRECGASALAPRSGGEVKLTHEVWCPWMAQFESRQRGAK
jgi:hypothetical protein